MYWVFNMHQAPDGRTGESIPDSGSRMYKARRTDWGWGCGALVGGVRVAREASGEEGKMQIICNLVSCSEEFGFYPEKQW